MQNNMTSSVIFTVIIFILFLTIADASTDTPITYLSYVDNAYGFYKVIDITTHKPSPYDNRTLIINQGDTITWMNDADNLVLIIVSEQKLFGDKRLDVRQRSSYTFSQIGTYTFYIKGFLDRRQTVIVNTIGIDISPTLTITPMATPTHTINTPIPTMTISPVPPSDPLSMTQIMSVVVAILSIFITYKVGKDDKEYKREHVEIEDDKEEHVEIEDDKEGHVEIEDDKEEHVEIEDDKEEHVEIEDEKRKWTENEEKFSSDIKYSQRIIGALCYSLGLMTGVIFLVLSRKENKFVRFHAIQSIATFLSLLVVLLIFGEIPSIGNILGPILIMIVPILWILLMIKACQGKIYKLPIVGNIAETRCYII